MSKEAVTKILNQVFNVGLIIVILSTLFLFANITTDFYETPKFLVLLTFTGLVFILSTLKFTLINKVNFSRTPLDLPLLILLVVGIASTILSASPFVSLLGYQPRIHTGLIALIVYILFYFLVVNNIRSFKTVKVLLYVLLGSGAVLSIISLLAYFGVKLLPDPWSHGVNFSTTGSPFAATAILAMLLPVSLFEILGNTRLNTKIIHTVLLILFGLTILLTGVPATYIAALAALAITYFILKPKLHSVGLPFVAGSVAVLIVVGILSFVPILNTGNNPFAKAAQSFPREIQLSFPISWKIAVSAFRDSPFWGTGPGTFLFDFTSYKPIEFNSTPNWNLRFDSAFNEYLQTLATLGGVGLIALLSLTALFLTSAWRNLYLASRHGGFEEGEKQTITALAVAGIIFFVILALHASTLSITVVGLLLLALFMALSMLNPGESNDHLGNSNPLYRFAANVSPLSPRSENIRIEALPSILLIIALGMVGAAFFFGAQFALADYYHRQALNSVAANDGLDAYNKLVNAEKLNPYNDLYRTDLSQINFALANSIAQAKGPTESSPSGSLTDEDKQNIQVLLQQAVNEGQTAVSLSPRSAINWEILGALYRQIAGVSDNALAFSLDAYGRAILNDPLNPLLRINVGGTYYAIQNYDLAIRFFSDSINLKPDFANGYYNLSVALRDRGDLAGAKQAAEAMMPLIPQDSPDYEAAKAYLEEVTTKANEASKVTQPPAADEDSALAEQDLPKVLDLPKPEKITTPSAVPTPTPSPAP